MTKTAQKVPQTVKPRGKPFQPGNDPRRGKSGGRPPSQHSLTYWLKEIGNTSPAALADQFTLYAEQLKQGGDLPFFALLSVRMLMAMANEPDVALLQLLFERTEGKVADVASEMPWDEFAKTNGVPQERIEQARKKAKDLADVLFEGVVPDDQT